MQAVFLTGTSRCVATSMSPALGLAFCGVAPNIAFRADFAGAGAAGDALTAADPKAPKGEAAGVEAAGVVAAALTPNAAGLAAALIPNAAEDGALGGGFAAAKAPNAFALAEGAGAAGSGINFWEGDVRWGNHFCLHSQTGAR